MGDGRVGVGGRKEGVGGRRETACALPYKRSGDSTTLHIDITV